MKDITLRANWIVKAPVNEVFAVMSDFEKFPEYFPKVADTIDIVKREGNHLEVHASVKSFGRAFYVTMKTEILPQKGYISDNESPQFGTSGHEELLLSEVPEGTKIDYLYQVAIHKPWLRVVAKPLIGWYSMKFWEKAVIDELKKRVEK